MTKPRLEEIFGGEIRFTILKALAEARQPATAYQIAISNGLDPAATYRYLTEFVELGIVKPSIKGRKQTAYRLSEETGRKLVAFLRSLKQQAPEPIDLEEWTEPKNQAERTARIIGLSTQIQKLPARTASQEISVEDLLARRVSGELSALIKSSQIAFRELFRQKGSIFVLRDNVS